MIRGRLYFKELVMNWKELYKIKCILVFILTAFSFIASITLMFYEIDGKEYIIGGLGAVIFMFPLVNIARYGNAFSDKIKKSYYILLLVYTVGLLIILILMQDFLLLAIDVLVGVIFWSANLCLVEHLYEKVKTLSQTLTKLLSIFMIMLTILFYINNSIITFDRGIQPVIFPVANSLFGLSIICLLIFSYITSKYRISGLISLGIAFIFYGAFKVDWILRNLERFSRGYMGTYIFIGIIFLVLIINSGIGIGRLLYDCARLKNTHKSILLGPWFSNILGLKNISRLDPLQKKVVLKAVSIIIVFLLVALPGLLFFLNTIRIPITIRPQDYQVTFNFFASGAINTMYTPTEKAEMNEHKVNLDLAMYTSNDSVAVLDDLEDQMPDVTYRLSIAPSKIENLYDEVNRVTELMLECESNGTLHNWKGLFFDIEGHAYAWYESYDSLAGSIAMWNKVFDYIDEKSLERGKRIDMESVNAIDFAVDVLFDGDYDMQATEGYNSYIPDRFSVYAPTCYRCWPVGDVITNAPKSKFDYWRTSYFIYSSIYTLQAGVQNQNKLGIYLGITNTSCYSRDVPQTDPATWGDGTGFGNLKRDVLIAKHFGIPEVTFFLQFNANDGGNFGGAFPSYGESFLDELNETCNTNPPAEFQIYYSFLDESILQMLGRDFFCDFSNTSGLFKIIEIVGLSFILFILMNKKERKTD